MGKPSWTKYVEINTEDKPMSIFSPQVYTIPETDRPIALGFFSRFQLYACMQNDIQLYARWGESPDKVATITAQQAQETNDVEWVNEAKARLTYLLDLEPTKDVYAII